MGTRADFYAEKNNQLVWLGSFAFDGYCIGEADENDVSPNDKKNRTRTYLESAIKNATDCDKYASLVREYLNKLDHSSFPENGWPWPWNNSKLTDEVYVFSDGCVWRQYGMEGSYEDQSTPAYFYRAHEIEWDDEGGVIDTIERRKFLMPDMTDKQNVAIGKRSGLITIQVNH